MCCCAGALLSTHSGSIACDQPLAEFGNGKVSAETGFTKLSMFDITGCALRADGSVWCFTR